MSQQFRFHREAAAAIAARSAAVFAFLDDHRGVAGHMEKPSLMMAGATLKVEPDGERGQAIGSLIRFNGSVLGIPLSVEETVIDYEPPRRKARETRREPHLLVIGLYRMGFDLAPQNAKTHLRDVTESDIELTPPVTEGVST